ncbi:MAG: DUF3108 domain-containing protein [Pseudohongiellaceae bacterium]
MSRLFAWMIVFTLSTPVIAAETVIYSAEYTARSNGLTATARRLLTGNEDNRYTLVNRMTVEVLGATLGRIEETSEFLWHNETVQSLRYTYAQSGIRSQRESVEFDWEANVVRGSEESETWESPLPESNTVYDPLNFQFSLRQRLQRNPSLTDLEFAIADSDQIDMQTWRVTGEEVVSTGLGPINCLRIERVRDESSRRSTTIWLAREWGMLLTRLVQTSSSGDETELLLSNAIIGADPVTAMP